MKCKSCEALKNAIVNHTKSVDRLMKEPPSYERGQRLAQLVISLEEVVQNTKSGESP
jgi:hypothetical protein